MLNYSVAELRIIFAAENNFAIMLMVTGRDYRVNIVNNFATIPDGSFMDGLHIYNVHSE